MRVTPFAIHGRRLALAFGVVGVVVAVLSFAPARRAAAEFLSVFRVRSFAAVPVDETRSGKLENLGTILDSGQLGEPEYLRKAGEPVVVSGPAAAAEIAGFEVATVADLPEGVDLVEMRAATGPHVRMSFDRRAVALALAAADLSDVSLPPIDTITLEVDLRSVVEAEYRVGGRDVTVIQAPSPIVTLPSGVPPDKLGEAFLQLLGLPHESARRLAADIDWTSTLVIPVPASAGRYTEVMVDGTPGLILSSNGHGSPAREEFLLWQREGVVYAVDGRGISRSLLIRVAESLQ